MILIASFADIFPVLILNEHSNFRLKLWFVYFSLVLCVLKHITRSQWWSYTRWVRCLDNPVTFCCTLSFYLFVSKKEINRFVIHNKSPVLTYFNYFPEQCHTSSPLVATFSETMSLWCRNCNCNWTFLIAPFNDSEALPTRHCYH